MQADLLLQLNGKLVVSCQADAGAPLDAPEHIAALAATVVEGGAAAVRIEGTRNIEAVSARVGVPIIGLIKTHRDDTDVYITPSLEDVRAIALAGAQMIAFDATNRPRPLPVGRLIEEAKRHDRLAMADVSTVEEARSAMAAGADIVSTTMAGYTPYSRADDGPDFALMGALDRAGIPFAAEGRIWTPAEALRCFEHGARFVVVGSAITRPAVITRRFNERIEGWSATPALREAIS